MDCTMLAEKIKTIPQDCIQDVADYIDFVCYKKEKQKYSVQDKDFSCVKALFGSTSQASAEEIRNSRINFSERT